MLTYFVSITAQLLSGRSSAHFSVDYRQLWCIPLTSAASRDGGIYNPFQTQTAFRRGAEVLGD
jgi:hypothetical protein